MLQTSVPTRHISWRPRQTSERRHSFANTPQCCLACPAIRKSGSGALPGDNLEELKTLLRIVEMEAGSASSDEGELLPELDPEDFELGRNRWPRRQHQVARVRRSLPLARRSPVLRSAAPANRPAISG